MIIGIESHFAEREGSGNCTYTQNLIRSLALIDKENKYILYCENKDFYFYKEIKRVNPNFKIVELRVKNIFFKIPFYLGFITYKDKVDVIHTQYYCPLISRGKRVVTIHDIIPIIYPEVFNWFEIFKQKFILPLFIRRADKIITGSDKSKEDICSYLKVKGNKIVRIYDGVSKDYKIIDHDKEIDVLNKFGIRGSYIYYIGRLDPRKNLKNVIKAFMRVAARDNSIILVIAGNKNEYFGKLDNLVKEYNLEEKVKFIGYISNKDNIRLLNFAEFFIFPSLYEGFGLPVLEAMACGCPVITSKWSSLGEIAEGCALLVNPKNVDEIKNAMLILLKDRSLRSRLVKKGISRAKEFLWEATAKKTLQAYKKVSKDK